MVKPTHRIIEGRKRPTISARKSADYLKLSDNALKPALEAGWIIAQQEFRRGNKMERGFVVAYLDEVKKILPKMRGRGLAVFTPEIVEKLLKLKASWDGKKDVDWEKDNRDTIRVMRELDPN